MKAEILKIAGVKSEKEFYKKFPTEEAFMKKYKKQFEKLSMGGAVRKKYAVGTKVNNYIETPNQSLSEHNRNMDLSMAEAESNPLLGMMQMLGQAGMSAGMQGMAGNMKPGLGKNLVGGLSNVLPGLLFAMGGNVPNVPVEIEGEEVGELPNGKVFEANGPAHEQGGIDISLPEGTEMYSKRIKVDGVNMADRKKKRAKREATLEEILNKNKTDAIVKNSLNRTKQNNQKEDEADRKIQDFIKAQLELQTRGKHFTGNTVIDIEGQEAMEAEDNRLMMNMIKDPEALSKFLSEKNSNAFNLKDINPGDALGMLGTAYSTFAPMQNTKNMLAGDTPNINPYENFGDKALATNDEMQRLLQLQKDEANKQIQLGSAAQSRTGRASARGISQMRAMDLVNNMQNKQASSATEMNFANQLQQLLGQKAGLLNQQEQMQMQGEMMKDQNDRADRDAFYSQFGKDLAGKGAGIQAFAKNLNTQKYSKETMAMIEKMKLAGYSSAERLAYLEALDMKSLNPNNKNTK